MDIYNNFQLVKANTRELHKYLVSDNEVNDWDKIIIIYNFYIFFSNLYIAYYLISMLTKNNNNNNNNIIIEFRNVYLLLYILCSIRTSYLYLIKNVCKINLILGTNLYNNTNKYFI